jgi:hypothetical protein
MRQTELVADDKEIAVHLSPVWRSKADFLIHADLASAALPGKWEQLWVRRLDENRFELCCIPFFATGLALGDQVDTAEVQGKQHVVHSVLAESGHTAARVAFLKLDQFEAQAPRVIEEMRRVGCLFEWHSVGYLAIDIADRRAFQHMDQVLADYGSAGQLKYEYTKLGTFEH